MPGVVYSTNNTTHTYPNPGHDCNNIASTACTNLVQLLALSWCIMQILHQNSADSYPQVIHSCANANRNVNANHLHTGGGVTAVKIICSTRLQMQKAKNNKKDTK